jgi:alkaline phosphatase D
VHDVPVFSKIFSPALSHHRRRVRGHRCDALSQPPFWEFVSGPLHAGTYGPNELDNTFGPEVKFIKAPGLDKQNLPPSAGMQFFGHVRIDGATGQLTVTLRDRADVALWSTTLEPKAG